MTRNGLRIGQVLWPSFLTAGVLEMLVFSVVDPLSLSVGAWNPSSETVYSLAFLVFWALMALASAGTQWMAGSLRSDEVEPDAGAPRRRRSRHGKTQHA